MTTLQAGRELDALVAEKVMGWKHFSHIAPGAAYPFWTDPDKIMYDNPPPYSTSIADAWLVVEKLKQQHINFWMHNFGTGAFTVEFLKGQTKECAFAITAPLAICLAALKAVGYEVET